MHQVVVVIRDHDQFARRRRDSSVQAGRLAHVAVVLEQHELTAGRLLSRGDERSHDLPRGIR